MSAMNWGNAVGEFRRRGAQVVEVLKETAFELSWDVRDAAKTGFGIPRLMASTASLGVATVAGVGVASVAFDFGGKVWGKRECGMCNGWEGLRCQICNGAGRVRYMLDESTLSESERATSKSVAQAAWEGRANVDYLVPGTTPNLPFPNIDCPQCDGTGVMTCRSCDGRPWVPKFTIARAMNAPWLALEAYRKSQPSSEPRPPVPLIDYGMFLDDSKAVEDNEDWALAHRERQKEKMEYDIIREEVKHKEPMWEELQEILKLKDPIRAARDDAIELDPPFYKANAKVLEKVSNLPVPARPADWLDIAKPLSESNWTKEDLADPKKRSEMESLLALQNDFHEKLLDRTWENHWRTQKFEEVKKEMIASYENDKDGYQQQESRQVDAESGASAPTASKKGREKPAPRKTVEDKKRSEGDKKKRERQERSERMAKQAADREAALMRAKAARERRD